MFGGADLDRFVMPRLTLGYRLEHGLGEIQFSYRHIDTSGRQELGGFDPFGAATLDTEFRAQTLDLDFCFQEFNAAGLPLIWPGFRVPGRLGLGSPLTTGWLPTPLEIRWTFGMRAANSNYLSSASGLTRTDRVTNVTRGGGAHAALELRQRLVADRNLFIHARADGSGVYAEVLQRFYRSQAAFPGGMPTVAGVGQDSSLGIPSVALELGLSWVPSLPERRWRWTLAYHFEQWFRFGDIGNSDASLSMGGLLMRGEMNF